MYNVQCDEGQTLETSASRNSLRRLIYLYQLSILLARRRNTTVSIETNHYVDAQCPFYIVFGGKSEKNEIVKTLQI